jgi:hypothetical protein
LARIQREIAHGVVVRDTSGAEDVREPWVRGLDERSYELTIEEFEGELCVVLEFGHDEVPGVRFRHRFAPPSDIGEPDYSEVHFVESVETHKLARSRARLGPDVGMVWTDFSWGHPANRLGRTMDLLRERRLTEAETLLRGVHATEGDLDLADDIAAVAARGTPASSDLQRLHDRCRREQAARREADRRMTDVFLAEQDRQRE